MNNKALALHMKEKDLVNNWHLWTVSTSEDVRKLSMGILQEHLIIREGNKRSGHSSPTYLVITATLCETVTNEPFAL